MRSVKCPVCVQPVVEGGGAGCHAYGPEDEYYSEERESNDDEPDLSTLLNEIAQRERREERSFMVRSPARAFSSYEISRCTTVPLSGGGPFGAQQCHVCDVAFRQDDFYTHTEGALNSMMYVLSSLGHTLSPPRRG